MWGNKSRLSQNQHLSCPRNVVKHSLHEQGLDNSALEPGERGIQSPACARGSATNPAGTVESHRQGQTCSMPMNHPRLTKKGELVAKLQSRGSSRHEERGKTLIENPPPTIQCKNPSLGMLYKNIYCCSLQKALQNFKRMWAI